MKNICAFLGLLLAPAIAGAQAPANDSFANRQVISTGLTTTNVTLATAEAGEPDTTTGRTVWYSYTATTDSIVSVDSTGTTFRYHFATAYIGTDINSLIYVDSGRNNDSAFTPFRFSFKAKAGTTYQICAGNEIATFHGSGREIKLTLSTTPFNHTGPLYTNTPTLDGYVHNDLFANRTTLAGPALTVINYMDSASSEAGERDTKTGKTAWYTYKAVTDSVVSLDSTGTEFRYHFASVYLGTSIDNLIQIDRGYSTSGSITPFNLKFRAKAGTTYQICVGSTQATLYSNATLLQFTLTTTPFTYAGTLYGPEVPTAPTPRNDSFFTPQALAGNLLTVIGSNTSATIEAGESGVKQSVWYTWTTNVARNVRLDLPVPISGGIFGVYTGSTPQSAVLVPSMAGVPAGSYLFTAKPGVTYRFRIAARNAAGQFQLTLTALAPPVNDAPVAKITYPKKGQVVPKKGFTIKGVYSDRNGVSAIQVRVNGKLVLSKNLPYSGAIKSGKVKKGKVRVQIRAKDTLGKWGPYHTVTVKAK